MSCPDLFPVACGEDAVGEEVGYAIADCGLFPFVSALQNSGVYRLRFIVEIPQLPPIDSSFLIVSSAVPSLIDSRMVQFENVRTFCSVSRSVVKQTQLSPNIFWATSYDSHTELCSIGVVPCFLHSSRISSRVGMGVLRAGSSDSRT